MDNKKILDKIKKCLMLAKSSNPHEAAIALKQAQILSKQSGIENPEILHHITHGNIVPISKTTDYCDYKLINLVNRIFKVESVLTRSSTNLSVRFFGADPNVEIASYIFVVISRLLKRSRIEYMKKHTDNRMKKNTKTKRANLFVSGWLNSIEDEVIKFMIHEQDITAEVKSTNHLKIREYINQFYTSPLQSVGLKAYKYKDADYIAFYEGKEEGKKAKINNAINQERAPRYLK